SGETKIWPLSTLFASTSAVGTLFDCSFTKETGFSGNGKCSLWMNETASRPSALHASISQTASSAARVAAMCSTVPSLSFAVYAQPPCTFTSSRPCSASPPLVITNAAAAAKSKATAHFELIDLAFSGLLLVSSSSAISQKVVRERARPAPVPRPARGQAPACESRLHRDVHRVLVPARSRPAMPEAQ